MRLAVVRDETTYVAVCLEELAREVPDGALVALPTGASPRPLYRALREGAPRGLLEAARILQLDEYVRPPRADDAFALELACEVLDPLGVPPERRVLLDAWARDLEASCRAHDEAIARSGGIELALLGVGANGHVGFNEPGTAPDAPTHVVALTPATRLANFGTLDPAVAPTHAITTGLGALRAARRVVVLVRGAAKRRPGLALLAGEPDPAWPVSLLADHPDLVVVWDATTLGEPDGELAAGA
jgi:glucosamine-6-phosphate deaminase